MIRGNYILGSSNKELRRLALQSEIFKAETLHSLKLAGIGSGMSCLDIGCGIGDTSFLMASLVGRDGSVIGMDANKDVIEICKKRAQKENITNVKFFVANIYGSKLKQNNFDFIFSRFLFQHLPDPKKALQEMIKLVTSDGIVAAEENDHGMWLTYPPSSGYEKLRRGYVDLLRFSRGDELIARKLYSLFLQLGLDTNVGAYSTCIPMNRTYSSVGILIAEVLRERILKAKLMKMKEFQKMMEELRRYSKVRHGLALYALTFRVWGKKQVTSN